jgi:hypothetical protein
MGGRLIATTVASESGVYKEIWKRMGLLMTAIEFPLLRTAVEMVKPGVEESSSVSWSTPRPPAIQAAARPLSHSSAFALLTTRSRINMLALSNIAAPLSNYTLCSPQRITMRRSSIWEKLSRDLMY